MEERFKHNKSEFKDRRKELRNNATSQEKKLWDYLKSSALGFKFQRQHSIGSYIVDFYCPKQKLIIELDGSQHQNAKEYDAERTTYFEAQEYKVIRFWNNEVDSAISDVMAKIQKCLTA